MNLIERDEREEKAHGSSLSNSRELDVRLKIYQDAYHQITGKTEKTSFRTSADLIIDFDELNQIHHKISQMCDIHNVIANSESVTVFHSKERKEQFTSFERFKIYNKSISSPTLTVVMEYNFSILPNGIQKPQQYKVSIRLNSRIAIMKQVQEEAPLFMRGRLYTFVRSSTAEISVEYADYVIARGFIEAVQEWVNGCKKSNSKRKFVQFLQGYSHLLPGAFSFFNGIVITVFFIKQIRDILSVDSTATDVLQYGVLFFSSFMLTSKLASFLGGTLEGCIDRYTPLSYLSLNSGDKRIVESYNEEKKSNLIQVAFSIISTLILGILSSKISSIL